MSPGSARLSVAPISMKQRNISTNIQQCEARGGLQQRREFLQHPPTRGPPRR